MPSDDERDVEKGTRMMMQVTMIVMMVMMMIVQLIKTNNLYY